MVSGVKVKKSEEGFLIPLCSVSSTSQADTEIQICTEGKKEIKATEEE